MAFNFKLEKVLNYKKTIEDQKKNQYGMTKRKLYDAEDRLDNFNKHKKYLSEEKDLSVTKIKAGDLALYNKYLEDMSERIKKQEKIVLKVGLELEAKEKEMIAAIKEKKIFEKLKENEYEKYTDDLKREEDRLVDGIISYKTSTQI